MGIFLFLFTVCNSNYTILEGLTGIPSPVLETHPNSRTSTNGKKKMMG